MEASKDYGILGNGTVDGSLKPIHVMDHVVQFDTAAGMVAAVTSDGSLWMWGSETDYLLRGMSNAESDYISCQTIPIKIMDGVADVMVDGHYALALKQDGTLWEWGDDWHGEPVQILDHVKWADVTENRVKAAICTDNSLWMWGFNERGQLGNGRQGDKIYGGDLYQSTPVKIMDQVAQVSLDLYCTAAVQTDGSLWAWGDSECGALGNNERYNYIHGEEGSSSLNLQTIPDKILDNIAFVELDGGVGRAIDRDGGLWMWGELDDYGVSNDTRENFSISINGSSSNGHRRLVPIQTVPYRFVPEAQHSLFFTSGNADSHTESFTDVGPVAYFVAPVYWCLANGITSGTSATTFSPNAVCTRAQILTFLWRAEGSPASTISAPFSDVADDAYYGDAAAWAYENKLISGNLFVGDAPATRADTVTYLWKLAGSPSPSCLNPFTDVPEGSGYRDAVLWALESGITAGTSDTIFAPDDTCTRAEIVTFIYRYTTETD